MADIMPLCGLRYNPEKIEKMEEVVTPPYDVIDQNSLEAFKKLHEYNMVKLDLSKNIDHEENPDLRYQQANELFQEWQETGILLQDNDPGIYIYHIIYQHPSGEILTRKGFVSLVGLAEFEENIIRPHEKTFREFTTDRLKLIDTCQAQFSKIFSLYPDSSGEIMENLEQGRSGDPIYSITDQAGCQHNLWAVSDPKIISRVKKLFKDKPVYIADGHHRYTTALQLREKYSSKGELPAESSYNYTMMYLCSMDDPGLSVLPTHRLVNLPTHAVSAVDITQKLENHFKIEEILNGTREMLTSEVLSRMNELHHNGTLNNATHTFGLYHPAEDRCFLLTLKDDYIGLDTQTQQVLAELDVVVLSDLILAKLLELDHAICEEKKLIDYHSDPDKAMDEAIKEVAVYEQITPVLFLLNNTPVVQVKKVADQGLFMPHKSTFFYPKILTGLVINKLTPTKDE
jgi:uncharacterized protein (DUF1015 family)